MRIEHSPDEGLLYLRLRPGTVAETIELNPEVYADLDKAGEPLGVEFLRADDFFPLLAQHIAVSDGLVVVDLPDGIAALIRERRAVATT